MPTDITHTETQICLENNILRAEFDSRTGVFIRLTNQATGWEIQGRAALADVFRLVVPLPDCLLNVVEGSKQQVVEIVEDVTNARLVFVWHKLHSERGGTLDINLKSMVTLDEEGLRFEMEIENHCPYRVESAAYPVIGDLTHPQGSEQLQRANLNYGNLNFKSLYPRFDNERGYWGVEYPIQMVPAPESPFLLVLAEKEGLYIGCHDVDAQERVEYTFQLIPGCGRIGYVPEESEIAGIAVREEFMAQHFPFVHPGETRALSPIVLRPFLGDWHSGVNIYKQWRQTWMSRPQVPDWLQDIHAWQQLQMTSWGDSLRIRYQELVEYGEECVRHGIKAIQLTGWTLYGQDGRLPIHDIDSRLGTWDELHDAIERIQAMGVQVILYEKYTCTDVGTNWYQQEGHHFASKDIFGNTHGHEGWQYDTPAHLAGINTRPYAWMCMNSSGWHAAALKQVSNSLRLNPAGILLDESQWHGRNAFYCFDETHGHRTPGHNFGGDAIFEARLRQLINSQNPNLVLAGEGGYDLQYRAYTMAYHRTFSGHVAGLRYIDPFLPLMNWVYGYDDRETINLCLRCRYIISYEPRHFRGHLDEFPVTLAYGKQVDALRRKYREYLWDAEFRDTLGAEVTVAGQPYLLYSVFQHGNRANKAVVITNDGSQEIVAHVTLIEPGLFSVATPEEPEARSCDGTVAIPPRSTAVVFSIVE